MEYILKIENLTKHYEKVIALDDISLEIEKGSIFGLLGPNGAGKTSLIRIITGINLPDSGSFVLNNISKNFEELSKILGYLPEERGLYTDMKIRDQLEFLGKLKGLQKQDCKKKINYYS
jgi:ABC-2 type transport system ATP-binding protein